MENKNNTLFKELSLSEISTNATVKKTLNIGKGYLELLVFLSEDGNTEIRQLYEKNPIPFLTAPENKPFNNSPHVGMKIPSNTIVKLDAQAAWPTLYLHKASKAGKEEITENLITISEKSLRVTANWHEGYNNVPQPDKTVKDSSEVIIDAGSEVDIKTLAGSPEDYFILLIMPYPIPAYDELVSVYFESSTKSKEADIILTCC